MLFTARRQKVETLAPGNIVTGTAASGDYDRPRTVVEIHEAPEHSVNGTAYRVLWANGTSNVYYGWAEVTVR